MATTQVATTARVKERPRSVCRTRRRRTEKMNDSIVASGKDQELLSHGIVVRRHGQRLENGSSRHLSMSAKGRTTKGTTRAAQPPARRSPRRGRAPGVAALSGVNT